MCGVWKDKVYGRKYGVGKAEDPEPNALTPYKQRVNYTSPALPYTDMAMVYAERVSAILFKFQEENHKYIVELNAQRLEERRIMAKESETRAREHEIMARLIESAIKCKSEKELAKFAASEHMIQHYQNVYNTHKENSTLTDEIEEECTREMRKIYDDLMNL